MPSWFGLNVPQQLLNSCWKLVRQRTVGSPARDYIPVLRVIDQARYIAGKLFGRKDWASDDKADKAREYRSKQQVYINKLLGDLKDRVESGDRTPSILGNIFCQDLLSYEEVLLAAYTGSMFFRLRSLFRYHRLMTARGQSPLASTSATRLLGPSATSPIGPICSRTVSRLFVRCITANHPSPMNSTVSSMSELCTRLVNIHLNFI